MLRKMNGKAAKGVALALALASMFAFAGCSKKQAGAPQAIGVKSMQVIKRDTPTVYDFTGFVEAQQEAKLMANVSGKIISKNFKGGDNVEAGQVLFTIDQRSYQASVLNAQAGLASAKAELIRLNTDVSRYETLLAQNAISRQTYDQIIAQRDQAQAAVDAQAALLENAQISMGDTEVRAPFSGRIDTSDLSVGNFVTAGNTVLATMSNVNPVRVKFSMSENEYLKLSKSHTDSGANSLENLTMVLSDGSTYNAKGIVEQIDRGVSEGTGTLTLKARFPNDSHILMPGMFAKLQANAGVTKNAMLIPQRAVKELLYKKFVYVIGSDNKIDMKEVKLGARVGRLWQVESGLEGNENLVVEGVQKVNKGAEVKPTAITEADLDTTAAKGESK